MGCSKFCTGKGKTTNSKVAKNITVYLNGFKTEKHKVTLDPNKLSKWYHILNEITNKIRPYFGTVKKLYSSDSGVTISSFTDLDNHGIYVASDSRKFRILEGGYLDDDDKQNYFEHYLTGHLCRNNRKRKLTHIRNGLIIIFVFNNGKNREPPKKFVLTKEDLKNWDQTLSFIGLSLDVPYRSIQALYNSNGNKICGSWELQHGASYIAVGYYEKFIPKNYRINESTTEYWKAGIPLIQIDKNRQCIHKNMKKSWMQDLKWKYSADYLYKSQIPENRTPHKCLCDNPSRNPQKLSYCSCQGASSSSSSNANNPALFIFPSDKCSFIQNRSSHRGNPLFNKYDRRYHPNEYCAYSI